jgi:hypothetical protein
MSRDARLVLALAAASIVASAAAGVYAVRRLAPLGGWLRSRSTADAEVAEARDPILYAEVEQATAAPPARFAARLPRVQEFGERTGEAFPPPAHVRDLLCAGDPEMWRRARDAITASGKVTLAQVADTYGGELRYCGGDGCFAAALLGQGDPAPVALPAWMALAHCPSAEAEAAFRRPDAPALAVLARAEQARGAAEEGGAALRAPEAAWVVAAAQEVLRSGPERERRGAAFELARAGPQGVEALLGLHARVREPKLRRDLAMALSEADDPRAQAIWKRSCAADGDDPACSRLAPREEEAAPEEEAAAGSAGPGSEGAAETTAAAPMVPPPAISPPELATRLRSFGLLPEGKAVSGASSADLLLAAGRAYGFDTETGQFPNEHDSLLRSLAALAGGGLKDALFEEVPPAEDDEEGAYVLRAYLAGERYQVQARNLGDWYDVEAVIGLLNSVARARQLEVRWLAFSTDDQTATVVAGPEKGLRDAIAARLLDVAELE